MKINHHRPPRLEQCQRKRYVYFYFIEVTQIVSCFFIRFHYHFTSSIYDVTFKCFDFIILFSHFTISSSSRQRKQSLKVMAEVCYGVSLFCTQCDKLYLFQYVIWQVVSKRRRSSLKKVPAPPHPPNFSISPFPLHSFSLPFSFPFHVYIP